VSRNPTSLLHLKQTDTLAFRKWFGDSKVVGESGEPLVLYHATKSDIEMFDDSKSADGGFHFGALDQASMRVSGQGKNLMPVYLSANKLQRSKDMGAKWGAKIRSAKAAGYQGIVYLNRFEGLSTEVICRLSDEGLLEKLDAMSDAEFRKAVPQAQDSYIVFRPEQIKSAVGNCGDFSCESPDIRCSSVAGYRERAR
jgi:hypothetical protein